MDACKGASEAGEEACSTAGSARKTRTRTGASPTQAIAVNTPTPLCSERNPPAMPWLIGAMPEAGRPGEERHKNP